MSKPIPAIKNSTQYIQIEILNEIILEIFVEKLTGKFKRRVTLRYRLL